MPAASLFSFAVNGGETYEVKLAQRALGLDDDGVVGPATIAAFAQPGAGDKIRKAQAAHYRDIYNSNSAKMENVHSRLDESSGPSVSESPPLGPFLSRYLFRHVTRAAPRYPPALASQ